MQKAPLNVLFITIDDLRPELASYKTEGILTPNLDRLAARGMQFNSAYSQYPVCNMSRMSFMTGLRPGTLGIYSNKTPLRQEWPDIVTLAQMFRENGYFTAGLGKIFHAGIDKEGNPAFFRDDKSFDYFFDARFSPHLEKSEEARVLGDGSILWAQWLAADGDDLAQPDGLLAQKAVSLLNQQRDEPFFIGVGFHKPHDPFIAPKKYFDLYPLNEVNLADIPVDRSSEITYALPNDKMFASFTEQDHREFKRAYYACTTFVDAQVGKLFDAMDDLDLWDNTIVVLFGDHGYHLGEHGWWNKVTVFDIGARVPLVMWVPGSGGMGSESDSVVELLDLYPSLAELAGLKPPHELDGKSLRPILENSADISPAPAYTQVRRSQIGMGYSVRYGDWRLTQWGRSGEGGFELYNVVEDKEGYYNHADTPEYAEVRNELLELLRAGYPQIGTDKLGD